MTDTAAATDADALVGERLDQLLSEVDPATDDATTLRGRQYDLGLAWVHFPVGRGGLDLAPNHQREVDRRLREAGWPPIDVRQFFGLTMAGPTVATHGSDELVERLLRRMFTGEDAWCQLFSEPGAGSDLAGLACKAVRDGDEWVIDGQKIYTSLAGYADYVWLAARTDPDVPKHKGITIFIVPTDTPGFSHQPLITLAGADTTYTFYEGVRVPDSAIVGGLNQGWSLIVNQLNYERVSLAIPAWAGRIFDRTVAWARDHKLADGGRVIDQEWAQILLARCKADIEYLKLLNWKAATTEQLNPALASGTKVYGTEMYLRVYRALLEVIGQAGYLKRGSPGAVLKGHLERSSQGTLILTFGGGTNEVQRDLVAMFGLQMPRAPRM